MNLATGLPLAFVMGGLGGGDHGLDLGWPAAEL